ncbi:MAG: ATP-binding protein [Oscillospiraceae bacterium]|nr:ATP-binding protein [Oscillospiraceae bacterium]
MSIIGRIYEQGELRRYYESGKPEFIAITGRRRVGKTYLVREMFSDEITFYFSGATGKGISNAFQLRRFDETLGDYGGSSQPYSQNWDDAFRKLRKLIEASPKDRRVIFIDELPWLDLPKSDFLPALDYFWNTFASANSDIMLIVCGSTASWMVKNLFENKGGLHNRITGRINLSPFTLGECEAYFKEYGIVMNRYQIAEIYMILGGIPYYLNMLKKNLGPTQNIDQLLFVDNAPLKNEFNEVYSSLFRSSEMHMSIVRALSAKASGLTREEIISTAKIQSGGNLTKALNELTQCGFVDKYTDFTKAKKNAYYRLIDPFTLYWLRFVDGNNTKDEYYWTNLLDDGGRRAWSGIAFEQLCLLHTAKIKQKLGISGISTQVFSWRSKNSNPGAQIDLLISRKDGVINICEMKYVISPFTIDKKYDQELQNKRNTFISETGTRSAVHITMITTYGVSEKGYRASIQSEVTLDDLFVV